MACYISLLRFTAEGAKNLKESTTRAHSFNQAAKTAGVTIEGQYWTMGGYDGVLVIRAESEEKALHCLTELAASGAVRTETMQAFSDHEFDAIVRR